MDIPLLRGVMHNLPQSKVLKELRQYCRTLALEIEYPLYLRLLLSRRNGETWARILGAPARQAPSNSSMREITGSIGFNVLINDVDPNIRKGAVYLAYWLGDDERRNVAQLIYERNEQALLELNARLYRRLKIAPAITAGSK